MNEGGMYRAGPPAAGLPLPRAGLGAFTGVVIAVSLLAAFVPWLLLMGRGPAGAWMTFRNGGAGMWFLALLDFALPVALGIAGAVVVRGKRVPSGLFFGVAVVPVFTAILFAYLALRLVDGALGSGAVDPQQAIRINAAGTAEALSLDQFGGFVTCGSALIGAVALAGAVASIDVATATRGDAERPSSVFGAATLVAGAAWFVATIVVTALRIRTVGPISIWVVFVVGLLVPLAVFAARAAPVLRVWHDPIEARRASGGLLVAGLAAMLAILVFERAILARTGSDVLGAVSGEAIDPSQRVRILMELVEARKWSSVAYGIHAVLGGLTFALAVAGTASSGRHPISPSTVMAASVGVFVLAAMFSLGVARARSTSRIAAEGAETAPKGITLARIDPSMNQWSRGEAGTIILHADGTNAGEPTSDRMCSRSILVFADRMATIEMLANKIPSEPCSVELVFAASVEKDRALEARLGDLAPFALGEIATFGVRYANRTPSLPSSGYLTVRALEDETIEYEGNKVKLPLGPGSPDLRAGRYELVRYVFRPNDTVGHVIRVIVALKQRFRAQVGFLGSEARLEIEWPPPPVPDTTKATLRLKAPIVAGRLPPEVITRIVRQNQGALLACYDAGLKRDPKLTGTVSVRFVIDRSGAVSSAQPESSIRDREVTSCIARAFKRIAFPEPEGGIVVVTFPLELGR